MTVVPGQKGTAGLEAFPDPDIQDGALLVRGMAAGICGTDREIAEGAYGTPPSGEARLVIGHESLGEVLDPAFDVDATALNRNMVLRNQVLVGTVNAGRRHWEQAAEALAAADPGWLGGLITRRVPLTSWTEALDRQPEDIKVVVDLTV